MDVNPITLEVVRNAVYSIAEEMRYILMRTARAPLLKEAGDLSCALTDAEGRLIAQGRDIPIHLGVMAATVKEFRRWLGDAPLEPGDIYLTNMLTVGGNHLPDVKAIKPIFYDGELLAFAIALAHWPDVGGAVPGSYYTTAREIYQEGIQFPPLRVFSAAGVDRTLLEVILLNVRGREEREGDIYGQRSACEVAAGRLLEVTARYGLATMRACFARFLAEAEQLMRAAVAEVPDGVYQGEDWMDDDGIGNEPVRIAVSVTVRGDEATFDFTGSDPQAEGPVNTTRFIAQSAVFYAAKSLFGPDIPTNDGCYRPFRVVVPEGTLLNPHPGAAVVCGNHETSRRVVDAIYRALAPALPDRVTASCHGSSGVLIVGGPGYISYETHGGGHGAGAAWDGISGTQTTMGNTMNTPMEALEASFPFLIERYSLVPNSGGAGRHRGGLGLCRAIRVLEGPAQLTTVAERTVFQPYGLFGGEPGRRLRVVLNPGTPRERELRGKTNCTMQAGEVIQIETAGGGGYGPPAERDPVLVALDRRLGYVE
ncbi:MAG: hydantoinase B/oxoprolinase family protein [Chloroflexi bacterium]|nr:hydantoinase B/oxoprolinase family protein [Chloroflexota bacterium]